MKPRFIFIHGNGGTDWRYAWAVWLKRKIEELGFETIFETMPDPEKARASKWLPYLKDTLQVNEEDVLIGYSSGAVAAMRYAESNQIRGSILISPSYTDLGDPLEKHSGYFNDKWLWNDIKKNQKKIVMVWGDDDPYIPQSEFAYIVLHLGADRIKIPMGEHFQHKQDFAEILNYIKKTYVPKA
ncbi:retinoblastoma-binding protein 9 [bacterium]|nr:MAG: retinoblastoma-binding protein 9 [bacterium]